MLTNFASSTSSAQLGPEEYSRSRSRRRSRSRSRSKSRSRRRSRSRSWSRNQSRSRSKSKSRSPAASMVVLASRATRWQDLLSEVPEMFRIQIH